jgi:hypothetical protein
LAARGQEGSTVSEASSPDPVEEVVEQVGPDRRSFVRRMIVGTAFAAPIVSSFNMNNLSMSVAGAGLNQTSP